MTDREKVISDLENIGLWFRNSDGAFNYACAKIIHNALELLKEQEPVKPKKDDAWPYPIPVCGVCGTCLFKVGDYKPNFCSECGRAVKWNDKR